MAQGLRPHIAGPGDRAVTNVAAEDCGAAVARRGLREVQHPEDVRRGKERFPKYDEGLAQGSDRRVAAPGYRYDLDARGGGRRRGERELVAHASGDVGRRVMNGNGDKAGDPAGVDRLGRGDGNRTRVQTAAEADADAAPRAST